MSMRTLLALIGAATCLFAEGPAKPALQQIRSVYLLPMSNGLDQYLANRLTTTGLYVVVTDPQKADALFTDHLGAAFEQKYEELYPTPKPESKEDKDDDTSVGKALDNSGKNFGSVSRSRGTVFLVDRASRSVIWSIYQPVKTSRPQDTNRRADDIARKLGTDIKQLTAPVK